MADLIPSSLKDARIWYIDEQPIRTSFEGDEGIAGKVTQTWGQVKIQLEEDGYLFLKDAERIKILGEEYKKIKEWRRIGIVDNFMFYEIRLERAN
jgi:hypothetical protein